MVRVRFAPSPTGDMHIGGLRTAIFDWLFAKANNGKFILRIEDTDRARYNKDSEITIIESLKWLGLNWDEGPDIGGPFEPYRQSERKAIYKTEVQKLINNNSAYYDGATPEELQSLREEQVINKIPPRYDGRGEITEKEALARKKDGKQVVVRFRVPKEQIEFFDEIRGMVNFDHKEIDDFIILKSDEMPTYHLAHVIDDHKMKISHVIRGEEWISSTPRHVLLHKALGFELPKYVHVPLLLGKDKSKLSKRHGAESALIYKEKGYLPEALLNFLALLGWSPGDNTEIMSITEIIKKFSVERILDHAAVFDPEKLEWMNASYIRNMDSKKLNEIIFKQVSKPIENKGLGIKDKTQIEKLTPLIKERLKNINDASYLLNYFFYDNLEINSDQLIPKNTSKESIIIGLQKSTELLQGIENLEPEILEGKFRVLADNLGLKAGQLFFPIRIALTGRKESPPLFHTMEALGKEKSIERIDKAIKIIERM